MKKITPLIVALFIFSIIIFGTDEFAFAQATSGAELALFEEIPMVVTPGKRPQPITESPAAVHVITQEEIRQNSSVNLWEILRRVPGLDVATITSGQANVSVRGFADLLTNKTLLMIDGRSLYLPIQGLLFWENIPVQPEEIDRIEVVKGSVSSLYGANANLGLINIITKTPKQMKGTTAVTSGGAKNTGRHSLIHAGEEGDLSYKVSAGFKQEDSFLARDRDGVDSVVGNMALEYQLDEDSKVSLWSGISQPDFYWMSHTRQLASSWYFGPMRSSMHYVQSNYESGDFSARIFWNSEKERYETSKNITVATINTIDLELQQRFDISDRNNLTIGAGGKFDHAESNLFLGDDDKTHSQSIWDVFIQDDYSLNEEIKLVGSYRLDHYPLGGYNPSARLSTIYTPHKNHLFRLSSAYSFRAPTLSDYYLNYVLDTTGTGITATAWGTKNLSPETYLTFEANYQGSYLENKLRPFVDVFWTKVDDIIESYSTGGGPFTLDSTFMNTGRVFSSGFELGSEYDISKALTISANYAFNHMQYKNVAESFFAPKHKINLGFKFKPSGSKWSGSLFAHYVSGEVSESFGGGETDSYVMANLWVGYRLNKATEVSIAGYNILHDKHVQYPEAAEIDTRILAKVEIKF